MVEESLVRVDIGELHHQGEQGDGSKDKTCTVGQHMSACTREMRFLGGYLPLEPTAAVF